MTESYSAAAARRAFECLVAERQAKARDTGGGHAAGDEERQTRAVEAEFTGARDAAERLDLLIRAARAEFDRACAHTGRFDTAGLRRSTENRVVRVVERAFDLLETLYDHREAGTTPRGGQWRAAFRDLARIRSNMAAVEAEMRRR